MDNNNSSAVQNAPVKGFNANFLKIFAALTMLIDHAAVTIVFAMLRATPNFDANWEILCDANSTAEQLAALPSDFANLFSVHQTMRLIGRIAFPIFCFLIYEGSKHTTNMRKYLLRLAICAVVSEIPFNLVLSLYNTGEATLLYPQTQNTVFTMLISLTMLFLMQKVEASEVSVAASIKQFMLQFAIVIAACMLALFLRTDYSYIGPLLCAIFYYCKNNKFLQIALGCMVLLPINVAHLFAFVPIFLYNETIFPSKKFKLFFYVFYPAHLLILFLVTMIL